MRRILLAVTGIVGLAALGWLLLPPRDASAAPHHWRNLHVLPQSISKDAMKADMKAQAAALGVDCDFCHDTDDFAKDNDHKKAARSMMLMVDGLDARYFEGKQVVVCATCHRGQKKPSVLGPGAVK